MSDDLKVVLLSEPAGVKLESVVYEGRTIYCAPPGESFSIQVTAKDPAKFRDLLGTTDRKIQINVQVDGHCIGHVRVLNLEAGTKFTYMHDGIGPYQLKFKEAAVDDAVEDLEIMQANVAQQWTSKVGTICVMWRLYIQGEEIIRTVVPANTGTTAAPAPPLAEQVVGATMKFWQRPSAAVEHGQAITSGPAAGPLRWHHKTFIPGAENTGTSTIWFHVPTVFAVFQNLAAHGTGTTATPLPHTNLTTIPAVKAEDNREDAIEQLPAPARAAVELVDLTTAAALASRAYKTDSSGVIDLMDSDVENAKPTKRARLATNNPSNKSDSNGKKAAKVVKKALKKQVIKQEQAAASTAVTTTSTTVPAATNAVTATATASVTISNDAESAAATTTA